MTRFDFFRVPTPSLDVLDVWDAFPNNQRSRPHGNTICVLISRTNKLGFCSFLVRFSRTNGAVFPNHFFGLVRFPRTAWFGIPLLFFLKESV
jgi:hypothetical protein